MVTLPKEASTLRSQLLSCTVVSTEVMTRSSRGASWPETALCSLKWMPIWKEEGEGEREKERGREGGERRKRGEASQE